MQRGRVRGPEAVWGGDEPDEPGEAGTRVEDAKTVTVEEDGVGCGGRWLLCWDEPSVTYSAREQHLVVHGATAFEAETANDISGDHEAADAGDGAERYQASENANADPRWPRTY